MAKKVSKKKESLPMEEMLWKACDALRGSIEPSEYKHVVLSLIFLKYAGFHFEKRRQEIIADGLEDFVDRVEFCKSASLNGKGGIKEKGYSLVPSKYIEFVNRDETVDYDTRMKELQSELSDILRAEAESRAAVLDVFKSLGYEINI